MDSVDAKLNLYKYQFRAIKMSTYKGSPSIAKPVFLLTIIEAIEDSVLKTNEISYEIMLPLFKKKCQSIGDGYVPNFYYPYYHLSNEEFYNIKWKNQPNPTSHPYAKYIKENISYTYLEDALWNLLQDKTAREELKQTILDFFFK